MALTDKLTAIGNAIRAKDGSTALLTLDEMPIAIAAIETSGGDSGIPEEAFLITGDCSYKFTVNGWNWFIEQYGDKITTENITNINYMFRNTGELKTIPFAINLNSTSKVECSYAFVNCREVPKIIINVNEGTSLSGMTNMFENCLVLEEINNFSANHTTYNDMAKVFSGCYKLKEVPYIYNAYPSSISNFFSSCKKIKTIPADYFDTWNFDRINTYNYAKVDSLFKSCSNLRTIPTQVFNKFCKETVSKTPSNLLYYQGFYSCMTLDEVIGLPIYSMPITSNSFMSIFNECYRLKDFTFETNEDGTAKAAQWKGQTIDLSVYVGYASSTTTIPDFTEITVDKGVSDAASYEALKNDADWYSARLYWARYDHDSAVNTINSLPDTSAYIAANGGTNTIKFKGEAGLYTDGGAINTLTEEEIAVAAAKGWTVTLS